ncbi:unnamed protein product [Trichogramma brassicae]|uniref:Uncharacterized protein n=1 Tax=Trichogramma brassicae TaxID=86971 RepID=A0A6H5IXA1_9HYME|nr:unnamed protein product [Trichogramma brassicae]
MPKVDKKSEKRSRNGATDMQHVDTFTQNKLDRLKCFREKVNWEIEGERLMFLKNLGHLIADWKLQLPKLRTIFQPEEIELILSDACDYRDVEKGTYPGKRIINFIARTGYKDEPTVDENGRTSWLRTTPLHQAGRNVFPGSHGVVADLFRIYDRFHVNYTDQYGLTHFDVACIFGCHSVVQKCLNLGQDPNCLSHPTVDSPLHLAVANGHKKVVELLLGRGAYANLPNASGNTPLHVICNRINDDDLVEVFFDAAVRSDQIVLVDALNSKGRTPLHLAAMRINTRVTDLLLRRDADPNLADAEGSTALHYVSNPLRTGGTSGQNKFKAATLFFDRIGKLNRALRVDAQDNLGNTSLHLALNAGCEPLAVTLLKNGVDPNLANGEGLTPVHVICQSKYDALIDKFLEITNEQLKPVQMDARDGLGRTPLQISVAYLKPKLFDTLMDYGADLSTFVFPIEDHFYKSCVKFEIKEDMDKLYLASRIMVVVERLTLRGYKLKQSDALTIVKLFQKFKFFENWSYLDENWREDKRIVKIARATMIAPNLSLYELIRMPAEDAKKQYTYLDYYNFWRSGELKKIPAKYLGACISHLCKMMMKEFFWRWALQCFWLLIGCRQHAESREKSDRATPARIIYADINAWIYRRSAVRQIYIDGYCPSQQIIVLARGTLFFRSSLDRRARRASSYIPRRSIFRRDDHRSSAGRPTNGRSSSSSRPTRGRSCPATRAQALVIAH